MKLSQRAVKQRSYLNLTFVFNISYKINIGGCRPKHRCAAERPKHLQSTSKSKMENGCDVLRGDWVIYPLFSFTYCTLLENTRGTHRTFSYKMEQVGINFHFPVKALWQFIVIPSWSFSFSFFICGPMPSFFFPLIKRNLLFFIKIQIKSKRIKDTPIKHYPRPMPSWFWLLYNRVNLVSLLSLQHLIDCLCHCDV